MERKGETQGEGTPPSRFIIIFPVDNLYRNMCVMCRP